MGLSLKESHACSEIAKLIYRFLPGSGSKSWTGHVTFQTVAMEIGVGQFWRGGSKEPAIAVLLEKTLEEKRGLFENLIIQIVRNGIRYCGKQGFPITEDEIINLNGLLLDVGFKFPELWDSQFLASLRIGGSDRAAELVEKELSTEKIQQLKTSNIELKRQMLRTTFYALSGQEDRQAAGREFEKVLNELLNYLI